MYNVLIPYIGARWERSKNALRVIVLFLQNIPFMFTDCCHFSSVVELRFSDGRNSRRFS